MKRAVLLAMILVLIFLVSACDKDTNDGTLMTQQETLPDMMPTLASDAKSKYDATEHNELTDSSEVEPKSVVDTQSGNIENNLTEQGKTVYVIQAGELALKYPEKWKDKVAVSVSDERVAFSCGETKLFDLVFNSDEGVVLGTVRGDKNIIISYVDYPLAQDDQELLEMKMDLNVVLWNLAADYDFVPDEAIRDKDSETFEIKTSVVTLNYPSRWKEKVTVAVTDQGVSFSSGDTKLFDLVFKECDGFRLGSYNGTPIYIIDYPVRTEEEMHMQQDVNVILQFLYEDSNFVSD